MCVCTQSDFCKTVQRFDLDQLCVGRYNSGMPTLRECDRVYGVTPWGMDEVAQSCRHSRLTVGVNTKSAVKSV
jgi:hypothetical protein